jgi:hypothetical protein
MMAIQTIEIRPGLSQRDSNHGISSNAYLIKRNGQAAGGVCSLDYRHNTGTPVYLEEGLSLELRPLINVLVHVSLVD